MNNISQPLFGYVVKVCHLTILSSDTASNNGTWHVFGLYLLTVVSCTVESSKLKILMQDVVKLFLDA